MLIMHDRKKPWDKSPRLTYTVEVEMSAVPRKGERVMTYGFPPVSFPRPSGKVSNVEWQPHNDMSQEHIRVTLR